MDPSNNLQMVPYCDKKRVCRYCKREFKCGRGLGGHIKVHFKGRKMIKFTHKKKNSRRLRRENEVISGRHIIDLSKCLDGFGWRVKKNRDKKKLMNKRVLLLKSDFSNNGDHVECDSEDSCDEDDYHTILLRKKLRSDGLTLTPHKICWSRRELVCKVCNESFKTYNDAFRHANEEGNEFGDEERPYTEIDRVVDDDERPEAEAEDFVGENEEQEKGENEIGDNNLGMGEKESNECNVGEVGEEMREKNGNGGSISMDQDMSTPKIINFDLNELPPPEED